MNLKVLILAKKSGIYVSQFVHYDIADQHHKVARVIEGAKSAASSYTPANLRQVPVPPRVYARLWDERGDLPIREIYCTPDPKERQSSPRTITILANSDTAEVMPEVVRSICRRLQISLEADKRLAPVARVDWDALYAPADVVARLILTDLS